MTKLCAEAMGFKLLYADDTSFPVCIESVNGAGFFDPLHDDAQAMALVKKFKLMVTPVFNRTGYDWVVTDYKGDGKGGSVAPGPSIQDITLNRAIVECVAKMHRVAR